MAGTTTRVGFIGLGAMGSRMAANVLAAGYPLAVYNRTRECTHDLAERGATVSESPRDEVLDLLSPAVSPAVKGCLDTLYRADAPATFAPRLGCKDLWLTAVAGYQEGAGLPLVAAALETAAMALRDHADKDVGRLAAFIDEMSAPGADA